MEGAKNIWASFLGSVLHKMSKYFLNEINLNQIFWFVCYTDQNNVVSNPKILPGFINPVSYPEKIDSC